MQLMPEFIALLLFSFHSTTQPNSGSLFLKHLDPLHTLYENLSNITHPCLGHCSEIPLCAYDLPLSIQQHNSLRLKHVLFVTVLLSLAILMVLVYNQTYSP
jgi:hypothetical protein